MQGSFKMEIDLGNAAMNTRGDLSRALAKVANKVHSGDVTGRVMDDNGNTVGFFTLTTEEG